MQTMICIRNCCHPLATVIGIVLTCSAVRAYSNTTTGTDNLHLGGPIIIPSNNEITLQKGQNFTLRCKGNKPIQLKQQEVPEGKYGSDFEMVQRSENSSDSYYKYVKVLELYNVDRFAVGYYGCFYNTVDEKHVLTNITEELSDTEQITYFYIYVNGSDSIFAPMREIVMARSDTSKVIIGCRPTTPDIKVKLSSPQSNKTPDILKYSPKIGFSVKTPLPYKCDGTNGIQNSSKFIRYSSKGPPKPNVEGVKYFLRGETFSINCTVKYISNMPTVLTWKIPRNYSKGVINHTNEYEVDDILYNNITIVNATEADAGNYICISKNGLYQEEKTFEKVFKEKGFVKLVKGLGNNKAILETNQNIKTLHSTINDYPTANIVLYKDDTELPKNSEKYLIKRKGNSVDVTIKKLNVYDTGLYNLVAYNAYETASLIYDLRRLAGPIINFGSDIPKTFLLNTKATLLCEAVGYPLPNISWTFKNENGQEQVISDKYDERLSLIKVISRVQIPAKASGNITCRAMNSVSSANSSKKFLVYEVANGFGIKNSDNTWFSEKQQVQLSCLASKYDFKNLTWLGNNDKELFDYVHYSSSKFSHIAVLVIDDIGLEEAGNYTCLGIKMDDSEESETIVITIEGIRKPTIVSKGPEHQNIEANPYQPVQLNCEANAVPPPDITWYKDGSQLNNSNVDISTEYLDHALINSTVFIKQMIEDNIGKYECIVTSGHEVTKRSFNLLIKEKPSNMPVYLGVCGIVAFLLILLVVYLAWKIRKEKKLRKELAEAGLYNFKEGLAFSLNPDLGIDEQAELLPYDEKFEFPPEKLEFGKQLGSGAFGVVYKAEARGMLNAEESMTVAVKMVKKNADNMYIKALASELKIMVHLGKHVNIVNLLGACTKNVEKRELIVIVEYCKFGNIHDYMRRHRDVFIDQLTDNKEKNLGRVNKAYSCSSASSGMHSDYFGSNHTQETDNTFVNTANTNRSVRKDIAPQAMEMLRVSETGYIQPEWRSNYESDYSFDGRNPRPLSSRDLLAWAFQIARGMEYLANRKVLHGDLAARNVLLAEDNIVKICDFGLARSIYKNDEYQKKENSPLPVKWLAIECMTDRIFSTQSDVWSFGIVLWELFSLAKTPYPNISPHNLLQMLNDGYRLEKPVYADDRLYDVMKRCWEQRPTARPSFGQLQEILGSFLEDNVRNHYVDLNLANVDLNIPEGQDYLAMVCAPDYNNMVTPSDHQYANDRRFFPNTPTPSQLQHDDEGYLQMSPANQTIFSPRSPGTKFDFDARKLNLRMTEATVHGSELTPMLTLNNLPAKSGSESDGNSPYLKMCPRIIEETDEVFETKQNLKNAQNTAVSNPTYTTFDVDLEKRPNISNNYINVNGLVK